MEKFMQQQPNLFEIGFSKTFEIAFSAAIHLDEMQGNAFQQLEGKVVELWIAPVKFPVFCLINNSKITTQTILNGDADVTLKTGLRQFRVLAQTGYFETKYIRGDALIGETFVKAMEGLEIDWEEHLSHYTGDLLAFKIGNGMRSIMQKKQDTKHSMSDAITEYLQFEINALPAPHQIKNFIEDVSMTANQVDDIEQRIETLMQKMKT